ncbi:S-adenosyl-L-methionine-dependent methyltransferase [Fomitiporia mediterranea MF3/22]|uniref:S-adenosyl-L-methionine-dependent methyltransferase n=1 Tax=Fomitiporia mediterranea (strain MF3/22) TaxID=694068 RepID=UPI00044096AE|nr:S-adenosyl-L-methionine-dependent methyltransferase [Fomitiporia mediterranea MF3/22]EJD03059.1 S-adenosyl-L-methionine-dependent methyltransferase [Fomitiporia mediterranea MF3/22]
MKLTERVLLKDTDMADRLVQSYFKDEHYPEGHTGEGRIVIEAFPGPGCLTRSLLKLPPSKIKRLIVLEEVPQFLEYLKPLEEVDPRVVVVPLSGFTWSTYTEIEARGLLHDVETRSWEDQQPNLHWIGQIPHSIYGDQLVSQFFRLIPERGWLFKYGRMPLSLTLPEQTYQRVIAERASQLYCKLSVVAKATNVIEEPVSPKELQPYNDFFHPSISEESVKKGPKTHTGTYRKGMHRLLGAPYAAMHVTPLANPVIEKGLLDKWDYILRRLFVLKTKPIRKAITSLGPGATNLLLVVNNPELPEEQRVNIDKKVNELDMREWTLMVKAFDEWPFAPEDLQITDTIYRDVEREHHR